jgi:hypothetical protein
MSNRPVTRAKPEVNSRSKRRSLGQMSAGSAAPDICPRPWTTRTSVQAAGQAGQMSGAPDIADKCLRAWTRETNVQTARGAGKRRYAGSIEPLNSRQAYDLYGLAFSPSASRRRPSPKQAAFRRQRAGRLEVNSRSKERSPGQMSARPDKCLRPWRPRTNVRCPKRSGQMSEGTGTSVHVRGPISHEVVILQDLKIIRPARQLATCPGRLVPSGQAMRRPRLRPPSAGQRCPVLGW